MPCNENAFQRKYVQNHFKESDKPPRLEQNLAKGTPKKEGVNQNWCWALGIKGKNRSVHPGDSGLGQSTSSSAFPL